MKDRLRRLYEESNKGTVDIFDKVLAPDFVSLRGGWICRLGRPQAFKEFYYSFLTTFPDLWFQVEDLVAEGDKCAVRGTLGGTH